MPCSKNTKTQNGNNIVTNSIKTFKKKLVHIKKILKKKKKSTGKVASNAINSQGQEDEIWLLSL